MDSVEKRQHHVNFLIEAASILPSDNHFHKVLRSYYLTKCKRLTQTDDDTNGNNLFGEEEMCKKCSTPWFDANFSLSIAPIKTTKRQAQKIHKQIEKKSNRKSNLAKKLSKKVNNTVTTTCKLCNTKNKVLLWKKPSTSKKSSEGKSGINLTTNDLEIVENKASDKLLPEPVCNKKSKKKRKKDKNAGLLYSIKKDDNSVKAVINIKQKLQKLDIQKPSLSTTSSQNTKKHQNPNKNKPSLQLQSRVNMKNTAKKGAKNTQKPPAKRNNLLQLANALKSKGNPSGSNSQADKLKQLLR